MTFPMTLPPEHYQQPQQWEAFYRQLLEGVRAIPQVHAAGVTVRETFNNGFVYQIDVLDTSNVLHTVWTGTDPSQPGTPVDFTVGFAATPYLVKGVKVYVDNNHGTLTIKNSTLHNNPSAGFFTAGFPGIFFHSSGHPIVTDSTVN